MKLPKTNDGGDGNESDDDGDGDDVGGEESEAGVYRGAKKEEEEEEHPVKKISHNKKSRQKGEGSFNQNSQIRSSIKHWAMHVLLQ